MTQQEVIKLLRKFKGEMLSTLEIKNFLNKNGSTTGSIASNLLKLEKQGDVKRIIRKKPLTHMWKLKNKRGRKPNER